MKTLYWIIILTHCSVLAYSQSLFYGTVEDQNGDPLPFATIYISDLMTGTATNQEGYFEIKIKPGNYTVLFQYLGYRTKEEKIKVGSNPINIDIQLSEEPYQLETVTVYDNGEDPAYSIMRKAIAKAKFHTQQIDEYTATSYIKGSGRLKGVPGLFRKRIERELKKEGIDTSTAFVSESINEIYYKRPDEFREKVISVRKIGNDNNTSPNNFINSSFYHPEINGAISPLSPKAFAYYKFEYLGFYSDRGHTINKIRVTPRSAGDLVFDGILYIVEDLWSIHSLELATIVWGIHFDIQQVYAPIQENVWLPVNQIFDVTGSFFGFKFEYKYFANIDDYQITLNPDLQFSPTIIDDKIKPREAKVADRQLKNDDVQATLDKLNNGEDISRKEIKKLMKEYEKAELEEARVDTLENVESIYNYEIDSTAYEKDSSYWQTVRPIPLTPYELKGYERMDSMSIIESEEAAEDTLTISIGSESDIVSTNNKKKQQRGISGILLGNNYPIGKKLDFGWDSPLLFTHFNTVEGWHSSYHFYLRNKSDKLRWRLDPYVQYSFARNRINTFARTTFSWGQAKKATNLTIEIGRKTEQLHSGILDPYLNDFYTLFLEKNWMKKYEKEYLKLSFSQRPSDYFSYQLSFEWAHRYHLENNSDFKIFDAGKRSFTSNSPYNVELGESIFNPYKAAIFTFQIESRPWLKYRIRNGRKLIQSQSSPTLGLLYRSAWKNIAQSTPSFHQLELEFKRTFEFGARGNLNVNIDAGTFINPENLGIVEFKHFNTNPAFFTYIDPSKSFRMLDFYRFSTQEEYYLEGHFNYQFRKLLFTRFPDIRNTGLKENLFINWLETPNSDHYFEAGFSLNYLFRVFRVEVVTAFEDGKYLDWGVRVGVASNLDNLFN